MDLATWNILHYSNHLLLDIYPLSREQYKKKSLYRRASYDYLNQIVETSYKLVEYIMMTLKLARAGKTYNQTFHEAKTLKVLPAEIVDAMIDLRRLRNKVVHENPKANEALSVYDNMLLIITIGFALFESFSAYFVFFDASQTAIKSQLKEGRIIKIDKVYLLKWLQVKSDQYWSDGFLDEYETSKKKAEMKLNGDESIASFTIEISDVCAHFVV